MRKEYKEATRRATRDLVRQGIIAKTGYCQACGDFVGDVITKHHKDYHNPYNIVWLCKSCHLEHHRFERLMGYGL